jgi:hypothetical protein
MHMHVLYASVFSVLLVCEQSNTLNYHIYSNAKGHMVVHLVEALCYKPEGHWNFSLTILLAALWP